MIETRKKVAEILRKVRLGSLRVKDALLLFPDDSKDRSVVACYHALIHYDADEDLRLRDKLYAEEQDDYIEFLSNIMEKGENVPENIIVNYEQYYKAGNIPHQKNTKGFIESFLRFLNV